MMLTFLAFAGTFLGMPIVTFLPVVAKSIFGLEREGLRVDDDHVRPRLGDRRAGRRGDGARGEEGEGRAEAAARVRRAAGRLRVLALAAAVAASSRSAPASASSA